MSDIAGYVRLPVREIRIFTDRAPEFRVLYDSAIAKVRQAREDAKASRSWFGRLCWTYFDDINEWGSLHTQHVPKWLRGDVLPDWASRVRGMAPEAIILMDVDDARLLRWITESMDKHATEALGLLGRGPQ